MRVLRRGFCVEKATSCTAASPGPQTPYRKPKQPSIIQQVQSEPATEEKAREGKMHPARESVQKHVMWSMFDDSAVCTAEQEAPQIEAVFE